MSELKGKQTAASFAAGKSDERVIGREGRTEEMTDSDLFTAFSIEPLSKSVCVHTSVL